MLFNHKIMEDPDYKSLTIFTTGLCNLNCSYCYICKDESGGLQQIDNEIKDAFDQNLYIKQILDVDPNCHNTIEQISLWGGEPFLKIYRFINHIQDFFKNFPYINKIDVSTNLTLSDHFERIQNLVKAIESNYNLLNLSDKKFILDIQISIDGYEEMNDFSRGLGVTQKIFKNWKKIVNNLIFDSNKMEIHFFTKSTFSKNTWSFVDTKEKAYKWCESFDKNLWQPWNKSDSDIVYYHGMWNNAMPSEYTQQDGFKYAKVTKAFADAYPLVIKNLKSWKEYSSIVSETLPSISFLKESNNNFEELKKYNKCKKCGMGCGVFAYQLVPIPNNKFTMCHRGLFDAYTDYANNLINKDHLNGLAELWTSIDAKKYWIFDKQEIQQMHNTMNKLYTYENQSYYTDLIQQIKEYADAGIIDSKYSILKNIEPTLSIFLLNSQCIQDDFIFGGSWITRTPLEIPLFYNGSIDIIMNEIYRVLKGTKNERVQFI